jgi:cytochrome c oxidase assembly factor CtaG
VEHLSFFGAGLLFWWPVIHPSGGRRRLGLGPAIFYLLPPLLEGNLLGALLTFSPQALYQTYILAPRTWGLSAQEDQQIGGLLMWVLGGMMWMIPLFAVLAAFLQGEERRAQMPVPTDS